MAHTSGKVITFNFGLVRWWCAANIEVCCINNAVTQPCNVNGVTEGQRERERDRESGREGTLAHRQLAYLTSNN